MKSVVDLYVVGLTAEYSCRPKVLKEFNAKTISELGMEASCRRHIHNLPPGGGEKNVLAVLNVAVFCQRKCLAQPSLS